MPAPPARPRPRPGSKDHDPRTGRASWRCAYWLLRVRAIPRLELRQRQPRLDRHHALAEIVERPLVGFGGAFEVQPDLEPAGAGVMPRLVVDLGMAVVELEKPPTAAAQLECLEVARQPR